MDKLRNPFILVDSLSDADMFMLWLLAITSQIEIREHSALMARMNKWMNERLTRV